MQAENRKMKQQVRLVVCLLFLYICVCLSACGGKNTESTAKGQLDVWFFACSDDADSILLKINDTSVIIDAGLEQDSDALIRKLKEQNVTEIALLILTHPDKDHIGGAGKLLDSFPVEQIIQTNCVKGSELQEKLNSRLEKETVSIPEEKEQFSFDGLQLTVYPPKEEEYEDSNNYSIAVLAEYEGKRFFFAGDAKKKRIGELLTEDLPYVDVYKAAHHGRDNGKSDDLIELLSPELAVVTAKAPEEKTAQAFEKIGTTVYSTYENDVHCIVTDGILDVE